jgi:heme/copper-type cytochrome/quinol oxidase subunit 4
LERRGYLTVLIAKALYGVVAVIHFFQHLNHKEADWAHLLLLVTNVAAIVGVIIVTMGWISRRRTGGESIGPA